MQASCSASWRAVHLQISRMESVTQRCEVLEQQERDFCAAEASSLCCSCPLSRIPCWQLAASSRVSARQEHHMRVCCSSNAQPLHLCMQILTSAGRRHLTAQRRRARSPAQLDNGNLCITDAPCPPSGLLAGAWQPQAADWAIPASLEHDGASQPLQYFAVSLQQQAAASAARLCQLRAGTGVCCHRFVSMRSVLCLCLAAQPAWPPYYIKAKLALAKRLPWKQSSVMCVHAVTAPSC